MFAASCFLSAAIVSLVTGSTNLITNEGFETSDTSITPWTRARCTVQIIQSDVHSGNNSALVTDRDRSWSGIRQELTGLISINKLYYMSAWVKLSGSYPTSFLFQLKVAYKFVNQNGDDIWKSETITTRYNPMEDGWVKIGGEISLTQSQGNPISYAAIYVEPRETSSFLDYIVDDYELYELNEDPGWRASALERVEQTRKANLTLRIRAGKTQRDYYTGMKFTVKQLSSEFGIGSSVDSFILETKPKYNETFYKNFEWAKLKKSLAWRSTEYNRNHLTWEAADAGIKVLADMSKRIRGAAIHEAIKSNQPDFVQKLEEPDSVYRASMKRVDDVLGRFRYQCEEWDVANDVLGGNSFLEKKYGSAKIYFDLLSRARDVDYAAKIYLNQSGLLPEDKYSSELLQLVNKLKQDQVDISGVSAHGRFHSKPSPSLILSRLDRIAETKLPIRLTDYSYSSPDVNERANVFDEIFLAALSHSSVEGIMLDDFWDGDNARVDASFYEGRDLTPNAAGTVLESWVNTLSKHSSEEIYDVTANEDTTWAPYRLYKGLYEVKVHRYDTSRDEWRLHRTYSAPLIKEKLPADDNYQLTIYL